MFEMIQKLPFSVSYQGLVCWKGLLCFGCAERLGIGRPDSQESIEWRDSPATGARQHKVVVSNKGSEVANPGFTCPTCDGEFEDTKPGFGGYGAEVSAYLWHIESHDPTRAELFRDKTRFLQTLADPEEDPDYKAWVREQLEAIESQLASA